MSDINQITVFGRLGADPDLRYTPGGSAVANLRVATTEKRKDKQSGEMNERTEWHAVVLFGQQAETAAKYLAKGRRVMVEGRLQTRKWQDKDGQDRYTTEIVVNRLHLIDFDSDGGRDGDSRDTRDGGGQRRRSTSKPGVGRNARTSTAPAPTGDDGAPFDDDIPF